MIRKKFILFISFAVFLISILFLSLDESKSIKQNSIQSFFINEKEYVDYIEKEVEFDDVTFKTIKIKKGDNFWKLAKRHNVNIDTLIGANPFWKNLFAKIGQKIIVPTKKGILHFITNPDEINEFCKIYNCDRIDIKVQNLPLFYSITNKLSGENKPIAIFILNRKPKPAFMTAKLASQFKIREMFRSPLGGRYSSFFGKRKDPIFRRQHFHNGLDIAARHGTPVGASCSGRVITTGWLGGYGKAVIIQHKDGYKTLYGHLSSINVRQGKKVKKGQFIGRVGSTGLSTGPHLHFTLWHHGKLINPMKILW